MSVVFYFGFLILQNEFYDLTITLSGDLKIEFSLVQIFYFVSSFVLFFLYICRVNFKTKQGT
jgi:hypothetical protein